MSMDAGRTKVSSWARYRDRHTAKDIEIGYRSCVSRKIETEPDIDTDRLRQMVAMINGGANKRDLDHFDSLYRQPEDPDHSAYIRVERSIMHIVAAAHPIERKKGRIGKKGKPTAPTAVVRISVLKERKRKMAAVRRLAFEVHQHGLNAGRLPDTLRWRRLWKALDGVPSVWMDRLYEEAGR